MKVVIQRVTSASVVVDDCSYGSIRQGILILLGVNNGDTEFEADWLAKKICGLRIFNDENGKMNRSVQEIGGSLLVVSQFTLAGNCDKGKRPSFDTAAPPKEGKRLYEYFIKSLKKLDIPVQTGIFQADMKVLLINDGPVTFVLEKYH